MPSGAREMQRSHDLQRRLLHDVVCSARVVVSVDAAMEVSAGVASEPTAAASTEVSAVVASEPTAAAATPPAGPKVTRARKPRRRYVSTIPDDILNDPKLRSMLDVLPPNYNFEVAKTCLLYTSPSPRDS